MNFVCIIPSRYASTRLPGKPLCDIAGKPMVQRVYEQASKASKLTAVVVAVDNPKVYDTVVSFGGRAVMTREDHTNGTDRLAEATAEYLHEKVRKEYWGYAPDESLSISDLYKVKYQGIRPAIGYPSLPDQLLNYTLDKLLNMSQIGVRLTENGAMYPTATVSGIYIAHPDSQYFMIGNIDEEQMKDYACRRNLSEAEVKKLLNKNISN